MSDLPPSVRSVTREGLTVTFNDWVEAAPLDSTTWPPVDSVAVAVLVRAGFHHRYGAGHVSHTIAFASLLRLGSMQAFGGRDEQWRLFWQSFPQPPIPDLEAE